MPASQARAATVGMTYTRQPGDLSHYDVSARIDGAIDLAHQVLHDELLAAFASDPDQWVWTPGYSGTPMSAADVFADHLDTRGTEHDQCEVILIIASVAARECDDGLQQRAADLLERIAERHADFHAADGAEL